MLKTVLSAKIHHIKVKEVHLNYSGSLTIDQDLMDKAGISPNERVEVYNQSNGARFNTYAIAGERGTGIIGVNGAAARLAYPGDYIIIATYGIIDSKEAADHKPTILIMKEDNTIDKIL
jgi:aspartate 1-decarboxylase